MKSRLSRLLLLLFACTIFGPPPRAMAATGDLDSLDLQLNSASIFAVAAQPDGKILLAGAFAEILGQTRQNLARLNADGTLDSTFTAGLNAPVTSLAVQADGRIVVGGTFTQTLQNGQPGANRFYVARLNEDGSLDATFDPSPNSFVSCVAVQPDGKVLFGGQFSAVQPGRTGNPVLRSRLARVNADGTLDSTFDPAPNSDVTCIAVQEDGKVVFGGAFASLAPNGGGSVQRPFLARVNADGTLDSGFSPFPNTMVECVAVQPDGRIVFSGRFATLQPGGQGATVTRLRLARLNADGSVDAAFDPRPDGNVLTLALQSDGKLLVGGTFTSLQPNGTGSPVLRTRVARLLPDGRVDSAFAPSADAMVLALALQADGRVLMAGEFNAVNSTPRAKFARLDNDSAVQSLTRPTASSVRWERRGAGPALSDVIFEHSADGGATYTVLGRGTPSATSNSWTLTGVPETAEGLVRASGATSGGYQSGSSGRVAQVAEFGSAGTLAGWNLGITGNVMCAAVEQPDGKVIVAGFFTQILGVSRAHVARLNTDGTLDQTFDPNPNGLVGCVAVQPDGKILLAGQFTSLQPNGAVSPVPRNRVARVNADGTLDATFDPNVNAEVYGLALQPNGAVLIAGDFNSVQPNGDTSPTMRNRVARFEASGALDGAFDPNADGRVSAMALQTDGKIVIGGAFGSLSPNGATVAAQRDHLARLNTDGTLDPTFTPGTDFYPNAIVQQADGKLIVGGFFGQAHSSGGAPWEARNNLLRLDANGVIDATFEPDPDHSVATIALQQDGRILVGGSFASFQSAGSNTRIARSAAARLEPNGAVEPTFNPSPSSNVSCITALSDGKILLGGKFSSLQPNLAGAAVSRRCFARLNGDPGEQRLSAPKSTRLLWTRSGGVPELTRVVFERSTDGGTTWTSFGSGTRVAGTGNWEITGVQLPRFAQLRARGTMVNSAQSGSSSLIEQVIPYEDTAVPTLSQVNIVSSNALGTRAKSNDTVTLSFVASEPINSPTVFIGGVAATVTNPTGDQWRATTTITPGSTNGPLSFVISFRDIAGNAGTAVTATSDGSSVIVDTATQPPTLSEPISGIVVNALNVSFTLPETALAGSVRLSLFGTKIYFLTLSDNSAGQRAITIDPQNPLGPQVASIFGGSVIEDGTYSVILSYQDLAGNTPGQTSAVTNVRIDSTKPVITAATIGPRWLRNGSTVTVFPTVSEGGLTAVIATIANRAPTNLFLAPPGAQLLIDDRVPEGPVSFSIKVADAAGNESSATTSTSDNSVAVVDRTPPDLAVPADRVIEATSAAGAVVTFTPSISDFFDPSPSLAIAPPSGSQFPLGATTVQMLASDAAGNQRSGSFQVTVRDTTAPDMSVAQAFEIPAELNGTALLGNLTTFVTASDLVGVTSITQSPAPTTVLGLGTHTVTLTASDAAGNSTSRLVTVTVSFDRPPAPGELTFAAWTGTLAPDAPGVPMGATLTAFGTPALSDTRAFIARTTLVAGKTKVAGIYSVEGGGASRILAVQGGPVPDATGTSLVGVTFKSFLDPIIAPSGSIAFAATLNGVAGGEDQGVWTNAFGPLALVLREGSDVPGLPSGFKLKSVVSLSLRDDRLLALIKLTGPITAVTAKDDTALIELTDVATGTLLLRTGGDRAGVKIKTVATLAPALGSAGQGRWHGDAATVAKVTLENGRVEVLKLVPGAAVVPLISTADAAIAAAPQAQWKTFGVPVMGGGDEHFATLASLQQKIGGVTALDDVALLSSQHGGAWNLLARRGALTPISAPAAGPRYASFFDPVANDAGTVAFLASLQGPGVTPKDRAALFCGDTNQLRVVARLNTKVPDESGVETTAVWSRFVNYALPRGPGANLIFIAETTGGDTTATNKLGLWVVDSAGQVRRLLRTGAVFVQGGPAVSGFTLLTATPGSFGAARSYNETGSLAVLVNFTDKKQALVRFDIP